MVRKASSPRSYLNGICKRDGDSERQAFRNSNHQNSDTDDEEFHKELHVNGRTILDPRQVLDPEGVDDKQHHQDDNSDG